MEEAQERKEYGKRGNWFSPKAPFPFFPPSTVPFRIPLIPPLLSTRYLRSNPLLLPSPQVISMHPSTNPRSEEEEGRVSARSKGEHAKEETRSNGKKKQDGWILQKKSRIKKVVYHVKDKNVQTDLRRDPEQFD